MIYCFFFSPPLFVFNLKPSESPDSFLQSQGYPIVLLGGENCLLAIGPTPLCTFPRELFYDTILYLMGCYYAFHLTYPKSLATLLSVIQTEILQDALHERDITSSHKKAIVDWKAFIDWVGWGVYDVWQNTRKVYTFRVTVSNCVLFQCLYLHFSTVLVLSAKCG